MCFGVGRFAAPVPRVKVSRFSLVKSRYVLLSSVELRRLRLGRLC